MAKKNANNWSRRRNNFTRIMFKFEFLSRVFFSSFYHDLLKFVKIIVSIKLDWIFLNLTLWKTRQ